MSDQPTLAWPHNRQLTDDRETYGSVHSLPCYANGGQYPHMRKNYIAPHIPMPNRASRRSSGQAKHRQFVNTSPRVLYIGKSEAQKHFERTVRLNDRELERLARAA